MLRDSIVSKEKNWFHYAAIVDRNYNLLVEATNFQLINDSLHAEDQVISKLKKKLVDGLYNYKKIKKGVIIIVLKITKTGYGISKPCSRCQKRLNDQRLIKKIIYSCYDGSLVTEHILRDGIPSSRNE